jgi:transposase
MDFDLDEDTLFRQPLTVAKRIALLKLMNSGEVKAVEVAKRLGISEAAVSKWKKAYADKAESDLKQSAKRSRRDKYSQINSEIVKFILKCEQEYPRTGIPLTWSIAQGLHCTRTPSHSVSSFASLAP